MIIIKKTKINDMYDYGARHYDASLGRWFVVDPLAEKYYTQSTYHFSGNNPILFLDTNGKDYVVTTYEDTKTRVIRANVYASTSDLESAQYAADYYNNQESINLDGYSVSYEISVVEVEIDSDSDTPAENQVFDKSKRDPSGMANSYFVKDDDEMPENKNGSTMGGNHMRVRKSKSKKLTAPHELGHALGMIHQDGTSMSTSEKGTGRSKRIPKSQVKKSIEAAQSGIPQQENGNKAGKGKEKYIPKLILHPPKSI